VASLVGIGRVLAGAHFPTDVAAGAAVGIGIGTLIPYLHDSPLTVTPELGSEHAGLTVGHRF
jgi:membrane-associated phospholipid phosphatase